MSSTNNNDGDTGVPPGDVGDVGGGGDPNDDGPETRMVAGTNTDTDSSSGIAGESSTYFTLPPELDGNGTFAPTAGEWPPDPERVTEWLVEERLNATAPCPLGFVCEENRMANCTKIRAASVAYGFGDVHGGGYCPEGLDELQLCPVGHYCPTADLLLVCPASFFCPHKTAVPEVSCQGCAAGEEMLVREWYGYLLMTLMFLLLGLYMFLTAFKKYQADLYDRFVDLSSRSLDSARAIYRRKQRMLELERLRPKLFAIQQRLEQLEKQRDDQGASDSSNTVYGTHYPGDLREEATGTSPKAAALNIDQDSGKITYQAGRLFDALDQDGDGFLDYDELQTILELNPFQLHAFVQRMNALAGISESSTNVARAVFTKYFLIVLEETTNFGPTTAEVEDLFDDISEGSDVAAFQDFFDSRLTMFLSDPQINTLISALRKYSAEVEHGKSKQLSDPGGGVRATKCTAHGEDKHDDGSGELSHRTPRRTSDGLVGGQQPSFLQRRANLVASNRFSVASLFTGAASGIDVKRNIHRDVFVKYYARVLAEVTTEDKVEDEQPEISTVNEKTFSRGIDLAFESLSLAVPVGNKKVNVVNEVSGRLPARTMTALMGGSGAGKTSLLNALCGRAFYGETIGTIRINGHVTSIEEHKDATGFVPQDDIVHAELTVKENLIFSGRFTLPKGTSMEEIEDLADAVLANLGLSRVADSIVGDVNRRGVSGGEKKRVNIGVELMSRPSILFLDEPTSGLDSSSALLVMGSLKNLTETQGVTVLSVIHQPRKAIFDSFDSLILLGVGGNMVYHGPVTEAESYLASLSKPYLLPPGESLADWLIDVSSGRLTPDKVSLQENPAALDVASSSLMTSTPAMALTVSMPTGVPTSSGRRRASAGVGSGRPPPDPSRMRHPQPQSSVGTKSDEDEQDQDHDHAMSTRGPSTAKFEHSLEMAKERRKVLYDCWDEYYKGLTGDGRDRYTPPTPYALPLPVEKPSFWTQLRGQIQRNILITWRNRSAAMVDTSMIVAAVVLISWLQGVTQVTRAQQPGLSFDQLVEGSPYEIPRTFPNLFRYAIGPTSVGVEFALKIGVITSVLLGLTAAKSLTAKRLEFFRESGSGWDINAYFLALNMTSTLEHFFQMVLAAGCAYWLRDSLAPWYSYQVQFIMLMWMTVSWSLLIPLLVPANNTTLAVGFFMAFFGLLFSGGIDPVTYRDIYDEGNSAMAIFTGIVSTTRYFIEGLTVAEQRCLPAQSGFTVEPTSVNFPVELVGSFNLAGLAQNDLSVVQRSCNGWYWGVYPALMVGLSLRFLAAGILHVSDRSKQAKKTLWSDLRKTPLAQNKTVRVVALFVFLVLIMFGISMYLILHQVGQTGILDEPQTEEEAARLVNMTLQGVFPGTQDSDLPPGLGNATSLNSTTSFEG